LPDERYITFLLYGLTATIILYVVIIHAHILRYSVIITIPCGIRTVGRFKYRLAPTVGYTEHMEPVIATVKRLEHIVFHRALSVRRKRIREGQCTAATHINRQALRCITSERIGYRQDYYVMVCFHLTPDLPLIDIIEVMRRLPLIGIIIVLRARRKLHTVFYTQCTVRIGYLKRSVRYLVYLYRIKRWGRFTSFLRCRSNLDYVKTRIHPADAERTAAAGIARYYIHRARTCHHAVIHIPLIVIRAC